MAQVLVDGRTVQVNDDAVEIIARDLRYVLQVECINDNQKKLRLISCLKRDSPPPAVKGALEKVRKELEEQT
jgi:hypothetical protein